MGVRGWSGGAGLGGKGWRTCVTSRPQLMGSQGVMTTLRARWEVGSVGRVDACPGCDRSSAKPSSQVVACSGSQQGRHM
jgi:hypothetical protein